jgi:hypothetical protein
LLAGAALIVLFFLYDVLRFTPLATPGFLSSGLLGGEDLGADTAADLRAARIAVFTILHLAAFTLLGIALARLFSIARLRRTLLAGGLYGLTVCTALFAASMQLTGTQMSAEPGWPAILVGNVAAGVVMVMYLRVAQGVGRSA